MKIKEVVVSQFAEDDLNEIVEYYFSLSEGYVDKIVPELEKQGILQYRELIQGYYRIIYEISEDVVIIHSIVDGRRCFEDVIISKLSRYYGDV